MSDENLPSEFDAIVLGTGMTECILAAAFSRVGYKVLHLDRNDYYSGDWATFHFKALRDWIGNYRKDVLQRCEIAELNNLLEEGEKLISLELNGTNIENVKEQIFVQEKLDLTPSEPEAKVGSANDSEVGSGEKAECEKSSSDGADSTAAGVAQKAEASKPVWTMEGMEKQWRKFNIDLMPKILYCRGSMVELLISSDIAKYCEFRTITRVLTKMDGKLQQVPCSRSDVFSSKQVNMIEKRMLMKHLTFAMEYEKHPEEYEGYEDRPFAEFLESKKLSSSVLHYVLHAIAMVSDTASTIEGLEKTKRFLQSLGRYGNTAFLWPLYGSGDIPQCFCRVCAVFGGTYCLSMAAQDAVIDKDDRVQGIINTKGQKLKTKWLIMESSYASKQLKSDAPQRKLSRAILLVDGTIFPDKDEHITLLSLPPPDGGTSPITVFELSSLSMACPKDLYVVQIICETVNDAETDLTPTVCSLYAWKSEEDSEASEKPKVLWSLFFDIVDSTKDKPKEGLPQNMFIVGGPDGDLDFEHSIQEAKSLFEKLCPDDEFLPKAPNPEDIIFDDGETAAPKDSGFGSDQPTEEDSNNAENEAKEEKQTTDEASCEGSEGDKANE